MPKTPTNSQTFILAHTENFYLSGYVTDAVYWSLKGKISRLNMDPSVSKKQPHFQEKVYIIL